MPFHRNFLPALCLALAAAFTSHAAAGALAPIDMAHTFAQVRQGDNAATLLVLALSEDRVQAIDLSELSGLYSADAFDVISRFDPATLDALARGAQYAQSYPASRLLGMGPRGLAHIAAGTNYPAHGTEVGMEEAFLFPKLSQATGPRSAIAAGPGMMLDYEVEVCARFDRELRSLSDFEQARKGFFLCGDFTDRATLVRNINLRNLTSGDGFPDAKSGRDRFPAGPLLVVPRDWQAFLRELTIETWVDGRRRQQAHARDMLKDLRTIVRETLDEAGTRTWPYAGGRIPMVNRAAIGTGSAILTGTGDGVIFQQPDAALVGKLMAEKYRSGQLAVIDSYVAGEIARGIYLQPGNEVRYTSNYLGAIHTTVVPTAHAGK
ncbi:fumarylacetoacetate hydrolase family protein [Massilia sp. SM-13]|uniref:fumarylacetoacetate hydrolase family protein n=1 Tax=Pseudoduganella rhizocola TaxID=3382643 RepID=UPI0038B5D549